MVLKMRQIADGDDCRQVAGFQADREAAAAKRIVLCVKSLRSEILLFELGRSPCAQGTAFRQRNGIEFSAHPVFVAERCSVSQVLKDDAAVQLADSSGHRKAHFLCAAHDEAAQIKRILMAEMIKVQQRFLLKGGFDDLCVIDVAQIVQPFFSVRICSLNRWTSSFVTGWLL